MKRTLIGLGLLLMAGSVFPQSVALSESTPSLDGVLSEGEYSFVADYGRLVVGFHRSGDRLYVAATAETDGWVAVGLGSRRMNGARMMFSFVDEGEANFRLDAGRGHRHRPVRDQALLAAILQTAVVETGDGTTMEVEAEAAAFIEDGQSTLEFIVAYGGADNFRSIHRFYNSGQVDLE